METTQDDWITRWARIEGDETRLRKMLASARGRKLLDWFQKNKMPPDALAFSFLHLVWPMQTIVADVKKLPLPNRGMRTKGAQQCRKTAHWLRKNSVNLDLPGMEAVCVQLDQYADKLLEKKFSIQTDSGLLSPRTVEVCLSPRNHVKNQVIAFLRSYFVIEGDKKRMRYAKRRTWEPITDFLILAKLVPSSTKPQRVGTQWSNMFRSNLVGDHDQNGQLIYVEDPEAEIKYAGAIYSWFHITKLKVDGKPQGKEDMYPQIMMELKKYLSPLAV